MTPSATRRDFLRLGAAGAAGAFAVSGHARQPGPPTAPAPAPARPRTGAEFITKETQEAINAGLDLIARSQQADGSFPERAFADRPGGATVGVTALAALALMAGGHQPGRGRYGRAVDKAAEYVAGTAGGPRPGFLTTADSQGGRLGSQPYPMYSHGFGTLFLAEVCGMLPAAGKDSKVRAALEQAVAFTAAAQNQEGGWRYEPLAQFADVSVTTAQMMALRAAKNAGLFVPKEAVVDKGVAYIKACQMPDGGFSYWKGHPGAYSAFARTAASVVGLNSAGLYAGTDGGREVERGLRYLRQFTPGRPFNARDIPPQHYWYGQYYAALAMWTAGDEYWAAWFPAIRDELLAKYQAGGRGWTDYHGPVYATAMALIVLQLPNNYLPILQK
jgi:hypothetical protein